MFHFLGSPKVQYFDDSGDPLVGGKVFVYLAGTSTKTNSYPTIADAIAQTNANANPVILDSRGEANIVLRIPSKLVLTASTDTDPPTSPIWTMDNVKDSLDLLDGNGNTLLAYSVAASAVNYLTIGNAATGVNPFLKGTGGDSSVGIDFKDSSDNFLLRLSKAASAVNYLSVTNSATASPVLIQAIGTDTNIGLTVAPKGAATLNLGAALTTGIKLVSNAPIMDASGNILISFVSVADSTSYVEITNGSAPSITGQKSGGTDFRVGSSGSGNMILKSGANFYKLNIAESAGLIDDVSAITAVRTITWPDSSFTMLAGGASAAQQETGTATTVAVTPAVQHRHTSAAKAWCQMFYIGGVPNIGSSYNVSSITDTGTGVAEVNLTTAFSSTNYAVSATKIGNLAVNYPPGIPAKLTTSYTVRITDDSALVADLPSDTIAFGDQ